MNNPGKILGLDLGDRHIGVAILDPEAAIALPLSPLQNNRSFLPRLRSIMAVQSVSSIVAGLPLTLAGTESPQTQKARLLAEKIQAATGIPVVFQDERYSSRQAGAMLKLSPGAPAHHLDSVAAQLILQSWWDAQNR